MSGEEVFAKYEPGEEPPQTAVSYEETAKFFFDAFKPYIAQDADWRDLVIIYEHFDYSQKKKIFDIGSQRKEDVMSNVFLEIENSHYPDRFTKLVEAFKICANTKAVGILEGKAIPKDERARSLIMNKGQAICANLLTTDIVPVLREKGAISVKDEENIMAKLESEGRWNANFELLFNLPSKKQDWFKIFMESLLEINQEELSEKINPEYCQGLQQIGTNEDMSLASCQPIESKDSVKGKSEGF